MIIQVIDCLRKFFKYVLSVTTLRNQVAFYTGGSQPEWRDVETERLPSPTILLKAALVDNTIFVTSGTDDRNNGFTSILSWDPSTESWQPAGNLSVGRFGHAAVAVPSSIIESECSANNS